MKKLPYPASMAHSAQAGRACSSIRLSQHTSTVAPNRSTKAEMVAPPRSKLRPNKKRMNRRSSNWVGVFILSRRNSSFDSSDRLHAPALAPAMRHSRFSSNSSRGKNTMRANILKVTARANQPMKPRSSCFSQAHRPIRVKNTLKMSICPMQNRPFSKNSEVEKPQQAHSPCSFGRPSWRAMPRIAQFAPTKGSIPARRTHTMAIRLVSKVRPVASSHRYTGRFHTARSRYTQMS